MLKKIITYLRSIDTWFFVIFLVTLIPAVWHLTDAPRTWFDEGLYLHIADVLGTRGEYGMHIAPGELSEMAFISVGYPLLAPVALSMKVFGATILGGRIVMVGFLLMTTLLAYAFAKRILSPGLAKLSALLVATFPPLYGNGKNVMGEIPGICFLFGASFMLSRGLETKRTVHLVFSGILFGLAMSTKPALLPLALLLVIAACYIYYKKYLTLKQIMMVAMPASILLMVWVVTQFSGIVSNPVLVFDHYNNIGNTPTVTPLVIKNIKAFLEFPTLQFTGVLVVITLAAWMKQGKTYSIPVTILLTFGTFIFLYFFRTPGWFRYLFFTQIIFLLMLPRSIQAFGKKPLAVLVSLLFLAIHLKELPRSLMQFDNPAWREARDLIVNTQASEAIFVNVAEAALWFPHDNYSQIIRIRDGLSYGEHNTPKLKTAPYVVARDSDEQWIEYEVGSYLTKQHKGNYIIWSR